MGRQTAAPSSGLEAWERRLWSNGISVIAGTDEAGRGPLAGPVVAAAFAVLPAGRDDAEVLELLGAVADSKQMTGARREEAFAQLTDTRFEGRIVWAIAESSVAEIDDVNILRAALTAMSRSVHALKIRPDCVLVDGCNRPPELLAPGQQWTRGHMKATDEAAQPKLSKWFASKPKEQSPSEASVEQPWRPRCVEAVIEGDARVPSISAASVLAKVHRDRLMQRLHERFPVYGFESHKGYGTEVHMAALREHGACPEHRRSFGPIREALGLGEDEAAAGRNVPGGLRLLFGGCNSAPDGKAAEEGAATPSAKVVGQARPASAKKATKPGRKRAAVTETTVDDDDDAQAAGGAESPPPQAEKRRLRRKTAGAAG